MNIGLIRERKIPADFRVPLVPWQCASLVQEYRDLKIYAESYPERCFSDEEYKEKGVIITDDLSHCDVIAGVKEIPVTALIPGKTYLFFSHTIKKQPHNRKLLQEVLKKNIRLIDYECLRYPDNNRILGFGRFAGIVGAYNSFLAWGKRYSLYHLKPAHQCFDRIELEHELTKVHLSPIKILLTGGGRVGNGALEVIQTLKIKKVSIEEFLHHEFKEPVYCQVEYPEYNKHKEGKEFNAQDFFKHPENYESDFKKFLSVTDLLIAGHFWASRSPRFFTREDMLDEHFSIKVIGDISCDIDGPIPATIRSSTIEKPLFGYDPETGMETDPFNPKSVTVMAVDNLPCELPRDASEDFGKSLMEEIIPLFIQGDKDDILKKATIAEKGKLTDNYKYLQDYVDE